MKDLLKKIVPTGVWRRLRKSRILRDHRRVARICDALIEEYYSLNEKPSLKPLKPELVGRKIIWQYWAQGFDQMPPVVAECVGSIDKNKSDYIVIRLDDTTVGEYVTIPEGIEVKTKKFSIAHYSDLLRLALLNTYGGVWLDATVMLSGTIPDNIGQMDFFMYRRDPEEPNKEYWEKAYAYYYGWSKGFRVNSLNSIILSKPSSEIVSSMYGILSLYWMKNDHLPNYFFFQILFDVLISGRLRDSNFPIKSDCKPHYLQQLRNDPHFSLATEEEILKTIPVHKLTYK